MDLYASDEVIGHIYRRNDPDGNPRIGDNNDNMRFYGQYQLANGESRKLLIRINMNQDVERRLRNAIATAPVRNVIADLPSLLVIARSGADDIGDFYFPMIIGLRNNQRLIARHYAVPVDN
ncbi:hypothetical protein THRCLA_22256 [Thraustotheca clavata]|uniref:Uncharacterized protein n=1 Tax=Thraustotheca clavata TaxID=74557 RepID=A0A1V9Z800_9STRA|nr:hypothetical protein THRCLA_22256 [Thraustotheca clavata]